MFLFFKFDIDILLSSKKINQLSWALRKKKNQPTLETTHLVN